jgi:alkylation response protein AidB-like acyl-CoA dehydrogenase
VDQRKWVDRVTAIGEEFAARARVCDEAAAYPAENFERLHRERLLHLAIPREYGGEGESGANSGLVLYLVAEVIARYCPTTSWDLMIHWHQIGILARLGSEEQKRRIFDDVLERVVLASMGTEINPTKIIATSSGEQKPVFESELRPVKGGFVANGKKHFCTLLRLSARPCRMRRIGCRSPSWHRTRP